VDFNPDFIARMIPKLEWSALVQAAQQVSPTYMYYLMLHICYLLAGRSVSGKTVPEYGLRSVLKTEGTVFHKAKTGI